MAIASNQPRKPQILIVEDDLQLTNLLSKALAGNQFQVLVANHGNEVKKMVAINDIKLIFLDINIPGKNGYEVLDELKSKRNSKNIPVIMLTNLAGQDQKSEALKRGAIDYFIKADIDFPRLKNIAEKYILETKNEEGEPESQTPLKNAIILHGTDVYKTKVQHKNNWYPWIKASLEKIGYEVWLPELPDAQKPNLDTYWHFLKNYHYNSETILIGHGSGATTVFGILNRLPPSIKIKLAVSIAGFYKDEGWDCLGLFNEKYDWEKIKAQSQKFLLIHSHDDPYVSGQHIDFFCKKLSVKPSIFLNKGHFNFETDPSFTEFPELLVLIKEHI